MRHEKNPRLWGALGNCLFLGCMPLGIYTLVNHHYNVLPYK